MCMRSIIAPRLGRDRGSTFAVLAIMGCVIALEVHSFYTRWYDCNSGGRKFKPILDTYVVLPKNIRKLYKFTMIAFDILIIDTFLWILQIASLIPLIHS